MENVPHWRNRNPVRLQHTYSSNPSLYQDKCKTRTFYFSDFLFYSFGGRGEDIFCVKSSALCNVLYIGLSRRNTFQSACKSFPEGRIMDLVWKSGIFRLQNLKMPNVLSFNGVTYLSLPLLPCQSQHYNNPQWITMKNIHQWYIKAFW